MPSTPSNQAHPVERIFLSSRGLHICFKNRAAAAAAHADAVLVGRASILEGTQVLEPRNAKKGLFRPKKA
ncbi:MAG: hypothetical protein WA949_10830 [Phormidesmis sp.]